MKRTARVELNRAAFDTLDVAHSDALFAVAVKVIETARPPDAPPYGKGLVQGGGALGFVGKKKVNGTTIGGRQIRKPRSLRLKGDEVAAIAGWGFPGRFVELGTVDTHADPFLTRAVAIVEPQAEVVISDAIAKRLRGERSFAGFRGRR